nr:MAG TPA: hypothetical protein [Bacteriophage sp.]
MAIEKDIITQLEICRYFADTWRLTAFSFQDIHFYIFDSKT